MQDRVMVLGFCPSPHCHLSRYQVLFNSSFKVICRARYQMDGRTDRQRGDYMLPPLGSIKMFNAFSCSLEIKIITLTNLPRQPTVLHFNGSLFRHSV